jgi:hypothetical protein
MINRKEVENAEYFNCFYGVKTNDVRYIHEIKSRSSMAKAAIKKEQAPFTSTLGLNLRTKAVNCSIWSVACMVLKIGCSGTKNKNTRKT